jgi:PHS family inorganic phosphate transporter-like MFS transporter
MMMAVTLMQPLGQAAAAAVGLIVLVTLGKRHGLNNLTESKEDHAAAAALIDKIWRIVVGAGAIPAGLAIIFRLTIPESPRFTLDVSHDGKQALKSNQEFLGEDVEDIEEKYDIFLDEDTDDEEEKANEPERTAGSVNISPSDEMISSLPLSQSASTHPIPDYSSQPGPIKAGGNQLRAAQPITNQGSIRQPHPFSISQLKQYFITEGNWRYLAACSICWFCLDFAFYGLSIGNPRIIAQMWASAHTVNATAIPEWKNPSNPDLSIYDTLYQDGWHYLITTCIGSLLGSLILIKIVDYVPRKAVLAWSFWGLFTMFIVVGASYFSTVYTDRHSVIITLYVLLQLLFNLGPNDLIFLVRLPFFFTEASKSYLRLSAYVNSGFA